jgi:DNA-binding MarR family transcriptional regulator
MEASQSDRRTRQALIWLGAAEQRLATRVNRALKGSDLPYAQFVVLGHLASLPGQLWTVTALATAMETGQPGVSKILHRLAAKGLVQVVPDAGDGRIRRHRLTPAGETAYQEAARRVAPLSRDIFTGWSDNDIESLHTLLYRLKSSLHRRAL